MSTCNFAHQTTHQSQSTSDFLFIKKKQKCLASSSSELFLFHNMHVVVVAKVCAPLCVLSDWSKDMQKKEKEKLYFIFPVWWCLSVHSLLLLLLRGWFLFLIHTHYRLCLSLFGLSRLIKSHIRRRGYTAGAERWRHHTDHPESAPAFKKEDKKKLWFWKIFWFRRAHRLLIHFFSTNSHYYFRQTHRETDTELSDGAFFFILVAEIEKSWNRKEIKIWSQFFMLMASSKPVQNISSN